MQEFYSPIGSGSSGLWLARSGAVIRYWLSDKVYGWAKSRYEEYPCLFSAESLSGQPLKLSGRHGSEGYKCHISIETILIDILPIYAIILSVRRG